MPTSLHNAKYACDTSRNVTNNGVGRALCTDVCFNSIDLKDPLSRAGECIFDHNSTCSNLSCKGGLRGKVAADVAKYLQDSPCCAGVIRNFCSEENNYNKACFLNDIRSALGLSGYKRISTSIIIDDASMVSITNLGVGMKYYFGVYALNEIGYSRPTFSMPPFEIPRALPPPPSTLKIYQVEPDESTNITLELAKESLDVEFIAPSFDNGNSIVSYFLEWDRRIQFDSGSTKAKRNYVCNENQKKQHQS